MCGMRLYISWPLKHSAVHLQEGDPRYGVEMTAEVFTDQEVLQWLEPSHAPVLIKHAPGEHFCVWGIVQLMIICQLC